jgi:hypothetical protein
VGADCHREPRIARAAPLQSARTKSTLPHRWKRGRARHCGVDGIYTERRLHQALGYRAPMALWREGAASAKAVAMMDSACASPICRQQQTRPLAG